MENQNYRVVFDGVREEDISKVFLSRVFTWMFLGLGVSALFAYLFYSQESLFSLLYNVNEFEGTMRLTMLGQIIRFSPLGFVLLMSLGYNKLSSNTLKGLFITFAMLLGSSLSVILMVYELNSIFAIFTASSLMFGIMAYAGAKTNTDLTKMGSLLYMALIGIIIASLLNWFLKSAQMSYIISIIGVIVFVGLTAYDTQKLKRIGMGVELEADSTSKLVIMGALTLYLDFINIFLYLLRLFGSKK